MRVNVFIVFYNFIWNFILLVRIRGVRSMGLDDGKGEIFIIFILIDNFFFYLRVRCF